MTQFQYFDSCPFTIGSFNMVFFFMYLLSGFFSLILLPFVIYFVCKKMGDDVSEINAKIIKISEMPT